MKRFCQPLHPFVRFALVGCVNTMNYYLIYLLSMSFGQRYLVSHTIGFIISMVGSFYLNCYFTYKVKPTLKKFVEFPLTYVANYTISTCSLFILIDLLSFHSLFSPIIASVIPVPFTYLISKWVLTKNIDEAV